MGRFIYFIYFLKNWLIHLDHLQETIWNDFLVRREGSSPELWMMKIQSQHVERMKQDFLEIP